MYLTIIIDLFNKKVVGWSMSDNLNTQDTIITAQNMVVKSSIITEELVSHSDRGSQYASYAFTDIIKSYDGVL